MQAPILAQRTERRDYGIVAIDNPDGEAPGDADEGLSRGERVQSLRAQFDHELREVRSAADLEAPRRRAESALSALRGELYATEAGRAEHQDREDGLERAVLARQRGGR